VPDSERGSVISERRSLISERFENFGAPRAGFGAPVHDFGAPVTHFGAFRKFRSAAILRMLKESKKAGRNPGLSLSSKILRSAD
jgi:hypothetical protein